jgi:signal transduction histidine kinase/ActR/RegA family two-component response regulator
MNEALLLSSIHQHEEAERAREAEIAQLKQFDRERETLLASERTARQEAEAANQAKDIFLATLSHELRTPLNAILGWASILNTGEEVDPEELKEGLEVIERNAKAQARLIEDVLDVSRIVSGKLNLEMRRCDLKKVIYAAGEAVHPAAEAKAIELEMDLDPQIGLVWCDATRMRQVVWNLLANAIKFTPQGGTVRVRLGRHGEKAVIEVRDSGQGIPPDFLPHVFERFRQGEGGTKRKFGGLGLGLSIVKHIIEGHGGTIAAASEGKGRGSSFAVELLIRTPPPPDPRAAATTTAAPDADTAGESVPLPTPAEEASAKQDERPTGDRPAGRALGGLRVLVVDDEADVRRLLFKALRGAGAKVTVASSAQEALALLGRERSDVLVSDIAMPERDGYELIEAIRAAGYPPQMLPAIALTAFAQENDRRRALRTGFQVHIAKPIDPDRLIAAVAALAGRRERDVPNA